MKSSTYFFSKILIGVFISLSLNSCVDDLFTQRDKTFNGQDQVEFKPTTNTVNARGSTDSSAIEVSPLLQLVSSKGTLGSDISIQFVVDDSSTAVAGEDYNISSSSPLTITAGEVSTELNIEVMADGLNQGDTRILYISQKSINGGNITPAANFKTYTLIIRGVTD